MLRTCHNNQFGTTQVILTFSADIKQEDNNNQQLLPGGVEEVRGRARARAKTHELVANTLKL